LLEVEGARIPVPHSCILATPLYQGARNLFSCNIGTGTVHRLLFARVYSLSLMKLIFLNSDKHRSAPFGSWRFYVRFCRRPQLSRSSYLLNAPCMAGLSNVYSVHVHMRLHHIGDPTTRQSW